MKKVLFIDTWTRGKQFTDPLAQLLSKHYELYYLHADSLFLPRDGVSQTGGELYQSIDICEHGFSFNKALKHIKPDLVVFISVHGFVQKWANLVAYSNGSPCVFFMHGVRVEERSTKKIKSLPQFFNKVRRSGYYSRLFFLYSKDVFGSVSIIFKKNKRKFRWICTLKYLLGEYLQLIFSNWKYTHYPKCKLGINYKVMFVNVESDIQYFIDHYEVTDSKYVVSGNLLARSLAKDALFKSNQRDKIIYISQPVVSCGMVKKAEYLDRLQAISWLLKVGGVGELIVAPHPVDDWSVIEELKKLGVVVGASGQLATYLSKAKLVVGINSAALLAAMDLQLPIIELVFSQYDAFPALAGYKKRYQYTAMSLDQDLLTWVESQSFMTASSAVIGLKQTEQIIFDQLLSGGLL